MPTIVAITAMNMIQNSMQSSMKRNEQIESGLYDGRYKQKVVPDKKKKANKNWARKTK